MPRRARTVVVPVFPGMHLLDAVGPLDVFAAANGVLDLETRSRRPRYELLLTSADGRPVRATNGVTITPNCALRSAPKTFDTLLVPGVVRITDLPRGAVVSWVRRAAPHARRVASVCSGAFVLAEAGLLDGRRATTHWSGCQELERRHPEVDVQRDPIFVRDGTVYTSAGVTAGIDLALALVEEDLGRGVALTVARWLVMYLRRAGGQAQFSSQLERQVAERVPIREAQAWIEEHPEDELTVARLARRAGMSPRNFGRVFGAQVGATPARYVATIRLEAARRCLEDSHQPLKTVAAACGYASVESLRRAFQQAMGTTPGKYRCHFQRGDERRSA